MDVRVGLVRRLGTAFISGYWGCDCRVYRVRALPNQPQYFCRSRITARGLGSDAHSATVSAPEHVDEMSASVHAAKAHGSVESGHGCPRLDGSIRAAVASLHLDAVAGAMFTLRSWRGLHWCVALRPPRSRWMRRYFPFERGIATQVYTPTLRRLLRWTARGAGRVSTDGPGMRSSKPPSERCSRNGRPMAP